MNILSLARRLEVQPSQPSRYCIHLRRERVELEDHLSWIVRSCTLLPIRVSKIARWNTMGTYTICMQLDLAAVLL